MPFRAVDSVHADLGVDLTEPSGTGFHVHMYGVELHVSLTISVGIGLFRYA